MSMESTLTSRGQTSVPARIRRRFGLRPGQRLSWIEDGRTIHLLPVAEDPIRSFRGSARDTGLGRALLSLRRRERSREHTSRHG